ncbi:MAG: phage tail tape measure protein [Candidatus Reddybacter sp.]
MSELKSRLVIEAVNKYSGPAEKIAKSNNLMADALGRTHKELLKIGKDRKAVANLTKYRDITRKAMAAEGQAQALVKQLRIERAKESQQIKQAKKQLDKLQAAKTAGSKVDAKAITALKRQSTASKSLQRAHEKGEKALKAATKQRILATGQSAKLSSRLKKEGIDTRNLTQANKRLGEQYASTQAKARAAGKAHGTYMAAKTHSQNAGQNAANATIVAAGAQNVGRRMLDSLTGSARQGMAFESAMVDVDKFVKNADIPKLSQQIKALGGASPLGSEGIAKLVAAGGRLKLNSEQAFKFAAVAERMSVSMALGIDSASESVAKLKSGMNLSMAQMEDLGDAINHMGDNSESNAGNIVDILTRVGSIGKAAGLAVPEIAALAAVIDGAAPSAEIAATGMKNILQTLSGGEQMAKAKRDMLDDLGFDASDLAQRMQENAVATTREVLASIADRDAAERSGIMEQLFGREALSSVANLVGNLDKYDQAMGEVADKTRRANSMTKEYAREMEKTETKLKLLREKFTNLKIQWGEKLLPVINDLSVGAGKLLDGLAWLSDKFPSATKAILLSVGLLGGAALVLAPVVLAVFTFKAALAQLNVMLAKTAATTAAASLAGGGVGGKAGRVKGLLKGRRLLKGAGALTAVLGAYDIYNTVNSEDENLNKGREVSRQLGGTGGALAGAAAGAFAGSFVPIIGTTIGAVLGGIIGGLGGDAIGDAFGKGVFADNTAIVKANRKSRRAVVAATLATATIATSAPVAAAGAGQNAIDNRDYSQVKITVAQQPGESADALVEKIERKINTRKARRRGSSFSDSV